jgi:hypothetical protein
LRPSKAAGLYGFFMLRSIVAHCKENEIIIDRFCCTRCNWFYSIENPKLARVDDRDVSPACRAFEMHDCREYPNRAA